MSFLNASEDFGFWFPDKNSRKPDLIHNTFSQTCFLLPRKFFLILWRNIFFSCPKIFFLAVRKNSCCMKKKILRWEKKVLPLCQKFFLTSGIISVGVVWFISGCTKSPFSLVKRRFKTCVQKNSLNNEVSKKSHLWPTKSRSRPKIISQVTGDVNYTSRKI